MPRPRVAGRARIDFKDRPEFVAAVVGGAERRNMSLLDYVRLALQEQLARDGIPLPVRPSKAAPESPKRKRPRGQPKKRSG